MNIHEYQGKKLFADFGVTVLENHVVENGADAAKAFTKLGGKVAAVKAQIHAGGRGKGNIKEHPEQHGVQIVKSAEEAQQVAEKLLGNHSVSYTHLTLPTICSV